MKILTRTTLFEGGYLPTAKVVKWTRVCKKKSENVL